MPLCRNRPSASLTLFHFVPGRSGSLRISQARRSRYHDYIRAAEDVHAGLCDASCCCCGWHGSGRRACGREDPACSNLGGDELHDVVQRSGGQLPDRLRHSQHAACGHRKHQRQRYLFVELQQRRRRELPNRVHGRPAAGRHHHDQQQRRQHGLHVELQQFAAHLSDRLRRAVAVAVACCLPIVVLKPPQPKAAMVSTIGSKAFSVAARPAAMASAAR
jgi:hypothetical protein